jgi:hypothetical protein
VFPEHIGERFVASSWMVAILSRASCFSLSNVSSSKAINLRTTGPASCVAGFVGIKAVRIKWFPRFGAMFPYYYVA